MGALQPVHPASQDLPMEYAIALTALCAMEIVLGIDNIVFIAILTGRLPESQQALARRTGLMLALVMRILLLLCISWILQLTDPIFSLSALGLSGDWLTPDIDQIAIKDLILLIGGLFLIWKSVTEIHKKILAEKKEQHATEGQAKFWGTIIQIGLMDLIFSLDSVITAVGMVKEIGIMISAVIIAIVVMLVFAGVISKFVASHPTLKMLALSFLILIGVLLVAEGIGTHFSKGYIYFAMFFALIVEGLNLWVGNRTKARKSRP